MNHEARQPWKNAIIPITPDPLRHTLSAIAIIVVLAVAIYAGSVRFNYLNYDDPQYVTDNPDVLHPSWMAAGRVFSEVLHPSYVAGYYQPLAIVSLMLDTALAGEANPHVSHAINVALHALVAVLMFLWVRRIVAVATATRMRTLPSFVLRAVRPDVFDQTAESSAESNAETDADRAAPQPAATAGAMTPASGATAQDSSDAYKQRMREQAARHLTPNLDRRVAFWSALLASIFFVVHPVNVEVVVWVCQRKALLATVFMLCALLAHHRWMLTGSWLAYGAIVIAFILSVLSKPTGWLLPAVMMALQWWPYRRLRRSDLIPVSPLLVIAVLAAGIAYVSQRRAMGNAPISLFDTPVESIIVMLHNFSHYLFRFVRHSSSPLDLAPDTISIMQPRFAFGVVSAVVILMLCAYAVRRGWRPLIVALVCYIALIGQSLGAVTFMGTLTADRFMYQPAIVLLAIAAAVVGPFLAIEQRRGLRPEWLAAASVILLFTAYPTLIYQHCFADSNAFWSVVIQKNPTSPEALFGYGSVAEEQSAQPGADPSLQELAIGRYRMALAVPNPDRRAAIRLASMLVDRGDFAEALAVLDTCFVDSADPARTFRPTSDRTNVFVRARALGGLGRTQEAVIHYLEYLAIRPGNPVALMNLANAYARLSQWQKAEETYRLRIEVPTRAADDGPAYYGLATALIRRGASDEALPLLLEARRLTPDNPDVHFVLARVLTTSGRFAEAAEALREAVRLQPIHAVTALRAKLFQPLFAPPNGASLRRELEQAAASTEAGRSDGAP